MRRGGFRGLLATGLVATGLATSTSVASANDDIFIKLAGTRGSSLDEKHKGESMVLSWSWGTSSGTGQTRRGTIPAACVQDLTLHKLLDSATPAIITTSVTGGGLYDAILTMRNANRQDYFILRMTNVTIPAYQTSAIAGDNDVTESVVLHFDVLDGRYRVQKADGSLGEEIRFQASGNCPQ